MKNYIGGLFALFIATIFSSCSSSMKSNMELLKEEEEAIERLIEREGFTILREIPEGRLMKENEFYHDEESDLYICIIDSGMGERPVLGQTKMRTRYEVHFFKDLDEPQVYNGFDGGLMPIRFLYDHDYGTNSMTPIVEGGDIPYDPEKRIDQSILLDVFGTGLGHYAPGYIRDGAKVRLIVPYDLGPAALAAEGEPLFFPNVEYHFDD